MTCKGRMYNNDLGHSCGASCITKITFITAWVGSRYITLIRSSLNLYHNNVIVSELDYITNYVFLVCSGLIVSSTRNGALV